MGKVFKHVGPAYKPGANKGKGRVKENVWQSPYKGVYEETYTAVRDRVLDWLAENVTSRHRRKDDACASSLVRSTGRRGDGLSINDCAGDCRRGTR